MFMFNQPGAYCHFPRQTYQPGDLSGEEAMALRARLERDARLDGLGEEEAEEAASAMLAHWYGRNYARCNIGRGDHARAFYAIRRYARLSNWKGFTGQRRARKAKITEAQLAARYRLAERHNPTPESVAVACERMARTPMHAGKAYRLAKSLGLPGVRELVREACGFAAE
jgi:hypothetical protein